MKTLMLAEILTFFDVIHIVKTSFVNLKMFFKISCNILFGKESVASGLFYLIFHFAINTAI